MKRKINIYYIILAVLIVILVLVEYLAPKPIDWRQSFEKQDKIPYGTKVLYDLLPACFSDDVKTNRLSFFEFSYENSFSEQSSYLIITSHFEPDQLDLERMLKYAGKGNNLFIAASNLNQQVLDTLDLELETYWFSNYQDSLDLKLVNPNINKEYNFNKSLYSNSFLHFNDSTTRILGLNQNDAPNFIRIYFGKGNIFINLQPLTFTNYHLLYSNSDYAFSALSVLPDNKVWFDSYYKPFRTQSQTPFRYMIANRGLKVALYLLLIGLLFYLLFESKRKQRAIPVIVPYKNTSLEFTKMIGRLYLGKKNHKDLADKMIKYFFEYLRNRYYIDTNIINQEILEDLHLKTGISMDKIHELFNYIAYINDKPILSDTDLVGLSNLIESFKNPVK